ncbi:MAG: mechanosensitive ion channel family protein [Thermoplasmata archaeon]|nr:mechanosensitive ion channel family protein [Thermoplasmata archaeon]
MVFTLSVLEPVVMFFTEYGPWLVLIILLIVVWMYALAYMTRYFEYLKMHESRYLDNRTLDIIRSVVQWIWVGILGILVLVVVSIQSGEEGFLLILNSLFLPVLFVVVVLLITVILANMLRRFADYLRMSVERKQEGLVGPEALGFVELFLKYLIYVLGGLIAVLGGLWLIGEAGVEGVRDWVNEIILYPIQAANLPHLGAIVVVVIAVTLIVLRLTSSLFEDMRRRSKKFSPRVIELLRRLSRYIIWGVATVVLVFLILSVLLDPFEVILAAVVFLLLVLAGIYVGIDTIRNALSGIGLMMSDPFDEGDRVKILDDLVCDIKSIDLALTQVETLRGEIISVPNSELIGKRTVNFSRSETYAMAVEANIAFDIPHAKVESLLMKAADKTDGIVDEPRPEVFAKSVDNGLILYQLLAYTDEPETMKEINSKLIYYVQDVFLEAGIKSLVT